jgi:hypothetical protein
MQPKLLANRLLARSISPLCTNCIEFETCKIVCRKEEKRRYKEKHPIAFNNQRKRSKKLAKARKKLNVIYEWHNFLTTLNPPKTSTKEYINEYQRRYYRNNRDKHIAKVKARAAIVGYQYNIETKRNNNNKRRSRKNGVEDTLTQEQRNKIYYNQQGLCLRCNQPFTADNPSTEDHIIPVSLRGGRTFENIQLLHKSCNSKKGCKIDPSNIISWLHPEHSAQLCKSIYSDT